MINERKIYYYYDKSNTDKSELISYPDQTIQMHAEPMQKVWLRYVQFHQVYKRNLTKHVL
ncbi:unnamed protein product [Musa acuminata subsp. malaccensis]|uniref:(wild Malaysian banana) hypothetical protein n=1 Tax=Musa acuminata subsp. malaccensis TaxID=214687 RepID=A0A804K7Z5_MUSAM|nr:unnamed protein product [Musa acuminata subsp. malaccensis]